MMDTDSQMITAVPVEVAIGDAVYGDGDTRQAFDDAGNSLIARVLGSADTPPSLIKVSRPLRSTGLGRRR